MQPTLIIMAAGMGSRYGGLKQLDRLGPGGETIMDYSIYDALQAGFGNIVFVIRKDFMADFEQVFTPRYGHHFSFEWVTQELDDLPAPFVPPAERTKPWGTGHALLVTSEKVNTPFGIINADDFYGKDAFRVLANFLKRKDLEPGACAMVGYRLENTLSRSGTVSRGICRQNRDGFLESITERFEIRKENSERIVSTIKNPDGTHSEIELAGQDLCSMNCWGFHPSVYTKAEQLVKQFLEKHGNHLSEEYHLPTLVNDIIQTKEGSCRVLETKARWFGVTYRDDRPQVIARLKALHTEGIYPTPLFP
ncbi:MAG: NTP transferase domain-containing protein [Bacteroidales bacterium]|nr:NTP transferase domain-containing protein [Bacteroidales bacterium]